MTRRLLPILVLLAIAAGAAAGSQRAEPRHAPSNEMPRGTIEIGLQRVKVEVADTPARKSQGLSGRAVLPDGHGMWFPYPGPSLHSFWMKDMEVDLDFVWVRQGAIVELHERVRAEGGSGTMIRPSEAADAVLEVPAGTIARWGWKVGDTVHVVQDGRW